MKVTFEIKRMIVGILFAIFVVHIFTANYEENGLLALQPFNIKVFSLLLIAIPQVYDSVKNLDRNRTYYQDRISGTILAFKLLPFYALYVYVVFYFIPDYFGIHFSSLWLGF